VNGAFTSGANGSSPAEDTIAVGTTMTWLYRDGDPYDGPVIFSEGTPSFSPPPLDLYFGKASFTFTTPGTYSYRGTYSSDPYEYDARGTLVVQ
jgi:plastocyanin